MCTTTSKATLLANAVLTSEMRRTLHAFGSDLVGSRNAAIESSQEDVVKKLINAIFNVAYEKVKENPFETYLPIIVSNKEFEAVGTPVEFKQARTMIENSEIKSLLNEINATLDDLNMTVEKLEVEHISSSLQFVKTSIRFN